jgi:hypothetical protein
MPEGDPALDCHRMPVGPITVEYAQVFCGHMEDNNAWTVNYFAEKCGAMVMSLRQVGMGGNGLRSLPAESVPEAIDGRFAAALPAAVLDAELVLDEQPDSQTAMDGLNLSLSQEIAGTVPSLAEFE